MQAGLPADDPYGSFIMSNPLNDRQNPTDPQRVAAEAPDSGPTPVVLVVEDDAWIRRAGGRKLQAAGFEVI